MTSVPGLLIAAQQLSLLALIGDLPAQPQDTSLKNIERQLSQILAREDVRRLSPDEDAVEYPYKWQLSWRMIFTWQCPMMFIGYSFLFYFIGLTVVICSPLIYRVAWGPPIYVSFLGSGSTIMKIGRLIFVDQVTLTYLLASGLAWGLFAYCSLGGYNAISLLDDEDESESLPGVETAGAEGLRAHVLSSHFHISYLYP
jgi:hypothetical protein